MVKTEAPACAKAAGNSYSLHLPLGAPLPRLYVAQPWVKGYNGEVSLSWRGQYSTVFNAPLGRPGSEAGDGLLSKSPTADLHCRRAWRACTS